MDSESPQTRLEATVRGRVQGVGFRFFVASRAAALGVRGWVANGPDGTVQCVAEGGRSDLEALLAALELGPVGARVQTVSRAWSTSVGSFDRFEIRSGWTSGD
jgi:acylphosphatase